jgi:hypothetical protein
VEALLELVARRPDAGAVFDAAGRALAGLHFSGPVGVLRRIARRLPRPLRQKAAVRALRAANGSYLVAAELAVQSEPRVERPGAEDSRPHRVSATWGRAMCVGGGVIR